MKKILFLAVFLFTAHSATAQTTNEVLDLSLLPDVGEATRFVLDSANRTVRVNELEPIRIKGDGSDGWCIEIMRATEITIADSTIIAAPLINRTDRVFTTNALRIRSGSSGETITLRGEGSGIRIINRAPIFVNGFNWWSGWLSGPREAFSAISFSLPYSLTEWNRNLVFHIVGEFGEISGNFAAAIGFVDESSNYSTNPNTNSNTFIVDAEIGNIDLIRNDALLFGISSNRLVIGGTINAPRMHLLDVRASNNSFTQINTYSSSRVVPVLNNNAIVYVEDDALFVRWLETREFPFGQGAQGIVFIGDKGVIIGNEFTLQEGRTLLIPQGAFLTIPDSINFINEGKIVIYGELANEGGLFNRGEIINKNFLVNVNRGEFLNEGEIVNESRILNFGDIIINGGTLSGNKIPGTFMPIPPVNATWAQSLGDIVLAQNYFWLNPATQLSVGEHRFPAVEHSFCGHFIANGEVVLNISKASGQTPPNLANMAIFADEQSIIFPPRPELEFSIDNGETWQNSHIFDSLEENTAYDFLVRRKETENLFASFPSAITVNTLNATVSVRNRNSIVKHGIILENAVVSDFARISVITPEPATANITIFDNLGNVVFTANDVRAGFKPAPTNVADNAVVWNLTNPNGRFVANGTYIIIAEATGISGRIYRYSARIGVRR